MIISIIVFILIIGLLVLVHETGHFIVARIFGITVEEFAIGFPPRLFTFKKKGTLYSINLIPLGGYVKLLGESGESKDHRAFVNKPAGKRLLVIVAGVIMNILLAIVLFSIGYQIGMTPMQLDPKTLGGDHKPIIIVANVVADSPAKIAGLESGDKILEINSNDNSEKNNISSVSQVQETTKKYKGSKVEIVIERDRTTKIIVASLDNSSTPLGVALVETATVKLGFLASIKAAFSETARAAGLIFVFVIKNFIVHGEVAKEIAGPVGIYSLTSQAIKLGFSFIIQLTAILSVNLAVLNILPFPALDGGRGLFILLEGIFKKKVIRDQVEATIHTIGFILLILALLALTVKDIIKLQ